LHIGPWRKGLRWRKMRVDCRFRHMMFALYFEMTKTGKIRSIVMMGYEGVQILRGMKYERENFEVWHFAF
jgi:hypothetical protein